jgi:hypothetical protein
MTIRARDLPWSHTMTMSRDATLKEMAAFLSAVDPSIIDALPE